MRLLHAAEQRFALAKAAGFKGDFDDYVDTIPKE